MFVRYAFKSAVSFFSVSNAEDLDPLAVVIGGVSGTATKMHEFLKSSPQVRIPADSPEIDDSFSSESGHCFKVAEEETKAPLAFLLCVRSDRNGGRTAVIRDNTLKHNWFG